MARFGNYTCSSHDCPAYTPALAWQVQLDGQGAAVYEEDTCCPVCYKPGIPAAMDDVLRALAVEPGMVAEPPVRAVA